MLTSLKSINVIKMRCFIDFFILGEILSILFESKKTFFFLKKAFYPLNISF